ncbi:mechanosensitive ion channel family protein [Gaiella sp.]|uniref:mechanosensitive ion channel family protein n=1 Tax=Gaiella sp. TaxID=2663207 RepID=UPI0039831245
MDLSNRTTETLITAGIGIAVVIALRVTLDFAYNRYETRLERRDPGAVARRRTTFHFARRIGVALVATIAVWSVLSLYDITSEIAKALLASSAVLALFAGLAFSTPLSNLGSGLLVAFTQPLRLGDRITVDGETGFVEEMALIYTTLVTDDARRVFVPNTQLTTSKIINRTIRDPRRLISAQFPVSIETPIDEAREALLASITTLPGTSGESARVLVGDIVDRTVWLQVATYGPMNADVVSLVSDLRELGLRALREKGFLAA